MVRSPILFGLVSIFFISAGCVRVAPRLDPALHPKSKPQFEEALKNAKECSDPKVATKLNLNFKYGCFCGAGYPDVKSTLPEDEKVIQYLSRKPIDSIDEVCRDHDICWTIHDDGDLHCNNEFRSRMNYIAGYFHRVGGGTPHDDRCGNLATDIEMAFQTIFAPEDLDVEKTISKFLALPAQLPYLVVTTTLSPYPVKDERCDNVPSEFKPFEGFFKSFGSMEGH